jgi:hypothetical protein
VRERESDPTLARLICLDVSGLKAEKLLRVAVGGT